MRLEFRLKQILDAARVPLHGTIQRIADDTGIGYRTIGKVMNNESATVSLATLQKICAWLHEQGYGEGLPGRLFGYRPSALMEAMVAPRRVKFWLGEYREKRVGGVVRARVSRDDFSVAARLIEQLCGMESRVSDIAGEPRRPLSFEYGHVLLHIPAEGGSLDETWTRQDQLQGEKAARLLEEERKPGTSVLIGSQHSNYLQECFVARMFGCRPYRAPEKALPFYLQFQEPTRAPSRFGGNDPPPGADKGAPAGIYYRGSGGRGWRHFPSEPQKRGAGIVIVRRNPDLVGLELSIFGLTGIATAAMSKLLCDMPERFWPTEGKRGDLDPAIYVCGFGLSMRDWEQDIDSVGIRNLEIVALDVDVPRRRRRAR